MSPLTHFTIYAAILQLPLSMTQKLLLCLVLTFAKRGLGMSNAAIGQALNVAESTVANTLSGLRKKGLIQTEKAGSRHRRIRPNTEALLHLLRSEVDEVYLTDLVSLPHSSLGKLPHSLSGIQKEGSKKKDYSARDAQSLGESGPNGNGFDCFWLAYPKKVGKDDARKAFIKRNPDAELLQTMLEAIEWQRQLPQWQKENGQYIPYPATWLNRGRWKDERPEPQPGSPDWLPTEEEAGEIERQAGVGA